jgi:uncharacterized protein YdbL (DUF1318 family)
MFRAGAVLVAAVAIGGCLNVKPLVVDRQTQVENQILGRLQRLEAELILASSVRAGKPAAAADKKPPAATKDALSPLAKEVVEALRRRAFNADDVDALKDEGVVGEGREGLLVMLAAPSDKRAAQRAADLLARENADRERIFRGVVHLDPELSERDLPLVRRIFARLQRAAARPGQKVQGEDAAWQTVPAPRRGAK